MPYKLSICNRHPKIKPTKTKTFGTDQLISSKDLFSKMLGAVKSRIILVGLESGDVLLISSMDDGALLRAAFGSAFRRL